MSIKDFEPDFSRETKLEPPKASLAGRLVQELILRAAIWVSQFYAPKDKLRQEKDDIFRLLERSKQIF